MQRIDFLGAPGVGKSTLCKEVLRRTPNSYFIGSNKAKIILAREYLKKSKTNKKKILANLVLKFLFIEPVRALIAKEILERSEHENLLNCKDEHSYFFESVLDSMLKSPKDPTRKFMGLNWFYTVSKTVFLLEKSKREGIVVFDESLSQKVYGVTDCDNEVYYEQVRNYFKNIPLPFCLIYCNLDTQTTFNRLKSRKKVIPGHRNLDDKKLLTIVENQHRIALIGKEVIQARGGTVIEIDMSIETKRASRILNKEIGELVLKAPMKK